MLSYLILPKTFGAKYYILGEIFFADMQGCMYFLIINRDYS